MRGFAGMAVLACTVFDPAMAATTDELVQEAREALVEGDADQATWLLKQADVEAPSSDMPVLQSTLAGIQYYQGLIVYMGDNRSEVALEYFRASLTLDPEFSWDVEILADLDSQRFYELLRTEVRSRAQIASGVEESENAPVVFLNGRVLYSYDSVLTGRHLVQVLCEEERMAGLWVEFQDTPPDYRCICDDSSCEEKRSPLRISGLSTQNWERRDLVLLGTGSSLLVVGAVLNFVLVTPLFNEITYYREHPSEINRMKADSLTGRFNTSRWTTLGLLGTGLAVTTLGIRGRF